MKTLQDLLQSCGSYFRSLCRISEFNNDGEECSLLNLPADCQIGFYTLNGKIGLTPLITSNGNNEDAKFWLTFDEAATILKAYAQAWERANPEGVWQEEARNSAMGGVINYGGLRLSVGRNAYDILENGEIIICNYGDEYDGRKALHSHLQSMKGGGK